jgi:hypothetical protein
MASFAFLFYYWLDFMLGDWTRVRAIKSRSGLVVWERGWWDFAVDPARYRLKVPGSLVSALGKLLPRPDLVMFLSAPPEVLHARKSELNVEELARQNRAWDRVVPSGIRQISVDAEGSLEQVVGSARDAITSHLEERAVGRLSAGWVSLPRPRDPRWVIPRGPRRVVRSALLMYQPVTPLGLGGWNAARVMARFGGFRLLPRSGAPPQEVRELLAPYVPPRGSFAVMRVRGSGRYVAMVLDGTGRPVAFAKVATEERGMAELQSEVRAISTLGSMLAPPASAPHIIDAAPGILVLGAVEWRPRLHPWRLPEQLAGAMGAFFAKGTGDHRSGPSHGDFAPWNVLGDGDGWVVVDWEHASSERPPMFDLFHYLVQGHALLGQPKVERLLEGLRGRGWVGLAIGAYCESAGLDPSEADSYLVTYLQDTKGAIDLSTSDGRRGQRARTALLAGLSMTSPAKGP